MAIFLIISINYVNLEIMTIRLKDPKVINVNLKDPKVINVNQSEDRSTQSQAHASQTLLRVILLYTTQHTQCKSKVIVYQCQAIIIKSWLKTKMINVDFSDLSGYRIDGRKNDELRQTFINIGFDSSADGSCLFRQGLTEVLCLVKGPYQRSNNDNNLIKIDYTVAPFSTIESRKIKFDKEFSEFTQNLRKSFEALIIDDQYKKSQIEVRVSVLKNEGSAKSAVVNAITLSLAQAGITMRDLLISCTAGYWNRNILIDTNEEEEFDLENQLIISYLPNEKKIDGLELKNAKLREEEFKNIERVVLNGCQELFKRLRKVLLDYAHKKMLVF